MSGQSSSPLRIACPSCGGRVKIPAGGLGQRFRCPRCDAEITEGAVPAPPPPTPTPPPTTVPRPVPAPPRDIPASQPGPAASSEDDEFAVHCPLCGTMQQVRRAQIGKNVRCPDCHSSITVRAPQPRRRPMVRPADEASEDEYRLSEPVERQQWLDLNSQILLAAAQQAEREADGDNRSRKPASDVVAQRGTANPAPADHGRDVVADRAREVLRQAQTEAELVAREAAERAPRPLFQRLMSFLFDVQTMLRLAILSLFALALMTMFQQVLRLGGGSAVMQFVALGLTMVMVPTGVVYLVVASVCWLAIVQDTANGCDKIQQWPGLNFLDWMFDSFYVINSFWVAAVPGVLLGQMFVMLGIAAQPVAMLLGFVTAGAGFPVMLLAAIDGGSPLSLWSAEVLRSLRRNARLTRMFYLASAGLALGALLSCYVLAMRWFPLRVAGAVALNMVLMVYFRLIGRLAGLLADERIEVEEGTEGTSETAGKSEA